MSESEIREAIVDYDDPKWMRLHPGDYASCFPGATIHDLSARRIGRWVVRWKFVSGPRYETLITVRQVIDTCARLQVHRPDRPTSEIVMDAHPDESWDHENDSPIIAVCGCVEPSPVDDSGVAALIKGLVHLRGAGGIVFGRHLMYSKMADSWTARARFLVEVSASPLL